MLFGWLFGLPQYVYITKHLLKCFDKNDIFQIEYQSWFQTDRCTIASKTVNVHEFMDILGEKVMKLKTHDFFAKKQSFFVNNVKSNVQEREFLVCCDFAENYAFVIQNSTQSFHWNNESPKIWPTEEKTINRRSGSMIITTNQTLRPTECFLFGVNIALPTVTS